MTVRIRRTRLSLAGSLPVSVDCLSVVRRVDLLMLEDSWSRRSLVIS